ECGGRYFAPLQELHVDMTVRQQLDLRRLAHRRPSPSFKIAAATNRAHILRRASQMATGDPSNLRPSFPAATTACVRVVTLSARNTADVWVLTVLLDKPSSRQMIFAGLPCRVI